MMVPAAKKLEDLIHLAELCVDLLQQNEEHYAEVRNTVYILLLSCLLSLVLYSQHSYPFSCFTRIFSLSICGFFVLSFIKCRRQTL